MKATIAGVTPNFVPAKRQVRIQPFTTSKTGSRPEILMTHDAIYAKYGAGQMALHRLLARTRAWKDYSSVLSPLIGYSAGSRAKVSKLAQRLFEVAVRAIEISQKEEKPDPRIISTAAEDIRNDAVAALRDITGISGILAQLRSPIIGRHEKWAIADSNLRTHSWRYYADFKHKINKKGLDLLVEALKDSSLSRFHHYFIEILTDKNDPRAASFQPKS